MELNQGMQILNLLIGKEEFENLTTDIIKEYIEEDMELKEIEPVIDIYSTIILLSGISKEIKKEECNIKISEDKSIIVKIQDICNRYEKYIQKVEETIDDLLSKIS